MSETQEVSEQKSEPKFKLNETGEIIPEKPPSRVGGFLSHLRMMYNYARTGIEQGWYRKPRSGEVRSNLEVLRSSLENSKPVEVISDGKIKEKK